MNKERLEQMKKEKLEQVKELGRGGLSRGLSMLREKANTALANGAAGGGFSAIGGGASAADDGEDVGTEAAAKAAGKPSYDDLVSLSMKLTRQNKLMKVQFQKMQARIVELHAREADCRVLTAFVSDVVGVDVDACLRTKSDDTDDANDENAAATIDAKQLRERFEIMDALKQKALKTQLEQLKAQLDSKTETQASMSLLPMSPAAGGQAPPAHAVAVPQYDEIDLLGDAFNSPVAQSAQQTNAFSADLLSLDMPTVTAAAPTTASTVLEKQLDEATEQLRRMEEEMKRSAAENEELRRKSNELWQHRTAQVEQLSAEKALLQKRLEEAESRSRSVEQYKAELEARVTDLETRVQTSVDPAATTEAHALREELKNAVVQKNDLEERLQTLHSSLEEKSATIDALRASVEALNQENQVLVTQAIASPRDVVAGTASSVDPSDSETPQLRERITELETQIEQLRQENEAEGADSASNSADISAVLEELERAKLARAEADHSVKTLQEKLAASETKYSKTLNEVEQNVAIIEALRTEIGHYTTEIKRIEVEHAASAEMTSHLEGERDRLMESKEALEEQLEVLRANNSSNLESVVRELAEAKKQVAEQREYMNGKIEVLVKELDSARKQCEALEVDLAEKEKQNQKMAVSQTAMTNEVMELQKQVSAMEQDLQMAAEGMEAHANKADESEMQRKETEELLKNARGQIDALKDQHLNDLEMLRSEKEGELDRIRQEKNQLVKKASEAEAAYESITMKCSNLQDELEQERKRTAELEARLGQLTAEVGNMSIDLAETKKALSDRMALATRLQTENMGFAEKQAEQAARVESALRDASASKEQVATMEAKVQDAQAEAERFKTERERAHQEMKSLKEAMESERRGMQQQLETLEAKHKTALLSEKDAFRRELDRVESESKHKSKLALHAVLEKEAEIERLSKRLAELEEDVRSGDADNRKIFEFAQMQASREMEARANAARIHELTRELDMANAKVQELIQEQARHGEELTAMMQTQRREGVNMEYLKNVIVQFMSFKPGSSQQLRLVPVITTLLQFTPADMKEIKKATGRRSSWATWGAEKLEYKPIAGIPTPASEAAAPQRRRTSPPSTSGGFPMSDSTARASSFTLPPHNESGGSAHHSTGESADF